MSEETVAAKIHAQAEYCKEKQLPHFAPQGGICWSCGQQIYNNISLKKASTELITGCSYCHRSYCS